MKVILLNGSSHKEGSTNRALTEIATTLEKEGIETEIIQAGNPEIRDCCGCGECRKLNKCVFEGDIVNELIEKAKTADGFIFGTPTYYAHPTGRILSIMDRAFFAGKANFQFKPAAAIAVARRAGSTDCVDTLNKYFTICNMPVVSSNYWNNVHGSNAEQLEQDLEGLQTMRVLGKNMAWLLKCIECGKQNGIEKPELEEKIWTNYIR